jgi:hypothetical protein
MATTTNYSWSTPDDTALVKDGAAAIRSLGTAIDTTVFTNAGAAVAKATVDAKGDLIAGTADNTVSRLAVGANDTVLTADSTEATGLKWATPAAAGGMTLLSTTTLSGATVTISGISGSYKILYGLIYGVTSATGGGLFLCKPNGSSSIVSRNIVDAAGVSSAHSGDWNLHSPGNGIKNTDANNAWHFYIHNYASTSNWKPIHWTGSYTDSDTVTTPVNGAGAIKTNSAITSFVYSN